MRIQMLRQEVALSVPSGARRLAWNYAQSKRKDFVDRMVRELYRKGVLVCRWHVSGDVFSPGYTRKLIEIMRQSQHTKFFGYSRSWSVTTIEPLLREMAELENMRLFYSADCETGMPPNVPDRVRVAWMQVDEVETLNEVDLLFRDKPLRIACVADGDEGVPGRDQRGQAEGHDVLDLRLLLAVRCRLPLLAHMRLPVVGSLLLAIGGCTMTYSDEEWKPVVGFEGVYEVSNLGLIKRIKAAPRHSRWPGLKATTQFQWLPNCRPPGWTDCQAVRPSGSR